MSQQQQDSEPQQQQQPDTPQAPKVDYKAILQKRLDALKKAKTSAPPQEARKVIQSVNQPSGDSRIMKQVLHHDKPSAIPNDFYDKEEKPKNPVKELRKKHMKIVERQKEKKVQQGQGIDLDRLAKESLPLILERLNR